MRHAARRSCAGRVPGAAGASATSRVLEAIASPRPRGLRPAGVASAAAGGTAPLPIGHGQTISQPYIVALHDRGARAARGERVLEIGTGSGYQTAVLAQLCARGVLGGDRPRAGRGRRASGWSGWASRTSTCARATARAGWPEAAPFDAIIAHRGAAATVPERAAGAAARRAGGWSLPVGAQEGDQELVRVTQRRGRAAPRSERLLPVRFVPMTGARLTRREAHRVAVSAANVRAMIICPVCEHQQAARRRVRAAAASGFAAPRRRGGRRSRRCRSWRRPRLAGGRRRRCRPSACRSWS